MNNIKKILAVALAVLMLVSLVACGGNSDPAGETTDPAVPNAGGETTQENDPATSDVTEIDEDLTVHENTFFTVGYKEEDGWMLAEDDIYTYDYGGEVYLRILDDDGYTDLLVRVEAYEESAGSFRSTLYDNGVDMKAYVEGIWVSENIGGQLMAAVDKDDGEWYFFSRNEAAGVSYTVYVSDWEDQRIADVVKNIIFTASATDNVDPPWPWDGEPFSGATLSQTVGTYTLTAEFLPMTEALVTYETFEHDIAVIGDKVYLLSDCALYQYAYSGSSLKLIKEIPLSGEYEIMDKTSDGNIVLS